MSRNLFIAGTGTDVGKTFITGLIVKKLADSGRNAAYFKAAVSGNERRPDGILIPGDALSVRNASGIAQPLEKMCPYVYENAFSPHLAAKIEGNPPEMAVIKSGFEALTKHYDFITVEGSGGILCPIRYDSQKIMLEDIVKELHLSCLLIADAGLGTINSVVLTCEYMKSRNINIKGIIFNHFHHGDVMEEDNRHMCEELTGIKVIACVEDDAEDFPLDADTLASLYTSESEEQS